MTEHLTKDGTPDKRFKEVSSISFFITLHQLLSSQNSDSTQFIFKNSILTSFHIFQNRDDETSTNDESSSNQTSNQSSEVVYDESNGDGIYK